MHVPVVFLKMEYVLVKEKVFDSMHTLNGIHLMKMKEELLSPLKCDDVPGTRVLSLVHQDTDEQERSLFFQGLESEG